MTQKKHKKKRSCYDALNDYGANPPSHSQTIQTILGIENDDAKLLASALYLTAGRISEVMSIRKKDISMEIDDDGDKFMRFKLINLKNKRVKNKMVISPFEHESELIKIIQDRIESLYDEAKLIPFRSRGWCYLLINEHTPFMFPHFLRALRITHLVNRFKYEGIPSMNFAGWTDTRPFKHYQLYRNEKKFMELMK